MQYDESLNSSLALVASCITNLPSAALQHRVAPEELASPDIADVYGAVMRILERGERPHIAAIDREMRAAGFALEAEARQQLDAACQDVVGGPGEWAPRVREDAYRRRLANLGRKLVSFADAGRNVADLKDILTEMVGHHAPIGSAGLSIAELLRQSYLPNVDADGILLRFGELDELIGPVAPGEMIVVGADTNVGKSTWALSMLVDEDNNLSGTRPVMAYISLEDSYMRIRRRLRRALEGYYLDMGTDPEDLREAVVAMINRSRGRIVAGPQLAPLEAVIDAMTRVRHDHGAEVVMVDYLQVIQGNQNYDRRNEIRTIAQRLKAHADAIGVVLILFSQVTVPESRIGDALWVPPLHALKESRDVANAAEAVIMLGRRRGGSILVQKIAKAKDGHVGALIGFEERHGAVVQTIPDPIRRTRNLQRERFEVIRAAEAEEVAESASGA